MNDLMPMLLMISLTNKKSFNNIKNAIEAADGFTSKINNMTSMMSMLPKLTSVLNNTGVLNQSPESSAYTDTLKDILSVLNSK